MRKYCYICGGKLSDLQARSWWCATCSQRYYDNPRPTVDVVLFDTSGRVLLTKRAFDPGKGKWDIPGGFLEFNERFEAALHRELKEELGITPEKYSKPVFITDSTLMYPWGKETYHIIDVSFAAILNENVTLTPGDDVSEAAYHGLDELEAVDFSWPPQRVVIRQAAKTLGFE